MTDFNAIREIVGTATYAQVMGDTSGAIDWLKAQSFVNDDAIGITGFCWGGRQTNALAVAAGGDVLAAAPYYGSQPPAADVPKIKARMMLHYAENDANINKGIAAYEDALKKAGTKFEMFTYPGTQHAFNNDGSAARYNKAAADLAWKRTVDMFKKELA